MSTRKQKGTAGLIAMVTMVLILGSVSALYVVVTGSVARGGFSAEKTGRLEAAAQTGLDWGRLRVRRGYCDGEAVFSGASALPPFPELTVRVSCVPSGTGFDVASVACTQLECPGAVPLPAGYSERRQTGTFSVGE